MWISGNRFISLMSEERQLGFKKIQWTKYLFERNIRQHNTMKVFTAAKAEVWERKVYTKYVNIFVFSKKSQWHTEFNIYWTFYELPKRNAKKSLIMCSYLLFFNFVLTVQYIKTIFKIVTCIFFKNIFFSSAWRKFLKTDHILGSKKNLFPKVEIGAFWRPQFTKQLETHN